MIIQVHSMMTLSTGLLTVQCNHNLFQKASRANAGDKMFYDSIYKRAFVERKRERTGRHRNSTIYRRCTKIKLWARSLILTTTWIPCRDFCSWRSPPATRAPSPRARSETSRASSSGVCLACLVIPECPARKSALRRFLSPIAGLAPTVHQLSLNEHLLAILAFFDPSSTRTLGSLANRTHGVVCMTPTLIA